ncbi:transglycosylase domain-containing protein [Aneurinibacillus aneurinilyticus]|uniref:transglycosylase domain-containing protein n=1 Tax=Aneurinibacillus aneurinilyticus TaxID=1391 RepID=UPI0023F4E2E5|nr:PBP1A family penicillin-binding protein [Aneurinibacillus aneurinilyticus]
MEKQNGSANTSDKPRRKKSFWHTLLATFQVLAILFFMGVLFAGGTAAGYVASLVKSDPVRSYNEIYQKISANNLTGFAYFKDKTMIGQLVTQEDRRLVSHKEVSPHLIDAIISTEDKYFYEHNGIVPTAIARAAIQQATNSSVQTGGSTLTQQLIKQTILSPKVTPERKFKEIFLALRMERMFSKDQILDAYINRMYFGKNANDSKVYGVQAAAKGIFGVDAKNLNIAQSAYLAGMLQAPSSYIPFKEKGLKLGKERQKVVLGRMLENGKINKQQYDEALAYDIKAHLAKPSPKAFEKYPYLMMEIEERAAKILLDQDFEKNPELKNDSYSKLLEEKRIAVRQGGYHIHTTIDKKIYEEMQKIAADPNNFGPEKPPINGKRMPEQVGAILIQNKTGAILGMMEGRSFKIENTSHVTAPRQPGSSIKPIGVYAPAIEEKIISPNSTVVDEETVFPGNWTPKNYGGSFKGPMSVRSALAQSRNIPAVKIYYETGVRKSLAYVKKMGVSTIEDNDYYLPTALGGFTRGISVEEITNAYATFANSGNFIDAYLIERIDNSEGETIYQHQVKPTPVFSPQTAWMMTDMMRDVVTGGTARKVARYTMGRDVAGKTGTTQEDGDKWFVGYTPDISLGVWVGYDKKYKLSRGSHDNAMNIWGKTFSSVLKINPDLSPAGNYMKRPPDTSTAAIYNANLAASKNPASYGKVEEKKPAEATTKKEDTTKTEQTDDKKTEEDGKKQEQGTETSGDKKEPDKPDEKKDTNKDNSKDSKKDNKKDNSKDTADNPDRKTTKSSEGTSKETKDKKSDKKPDHSIGKKDEKKGEG